MWDHDILGGERNFGHRFFGSIPLAECRLIERIGCVGVRQAAGTPLCSISLDGERCLERLDVVVRCELNVRRFAVNILSHTRSSRHRVRVATRAYHRDVYP